VIIELMTEKGKSVISFQTQFVFNTYRLNVITDLARRGHVVLRDCKHNGYSCNAKSNEQQE
jgi:hypothetical protein